MADSSFYKVTRNDVVKLQLRHTLVPRQPFGGIVDEDGDDLQHKQSWCGSWSPDRSWFAWSQGNKSVVLVPCDGSGLPATDCSSTVRVIQCNSEVRSLCFSLAQPCRRPRKASLRYRRFNLTGHMVLAIGLQNGFIRPYDVCCLDNSQVGPLKDHQKPVPALSFSPDNSLMLASASLDGTCKLWDLHDDGNMGLELRVPGCSGFMDVQWSPRADCLAAVGMESTVAVWHVSPGGGKPEYIRLRGHQNTVVSCVFSPDGALLVTGSQDTRILVWDPSTGDRLLQPVTVNGSVLGHMHPAPGIIQAGGFNGHFIRCVDVAACGLQVASVCEDGLLRIWDLREPEDPVMCAELNVPATFCRFSYDGSIVAVGSVCGRVHFYEVARSPCALLQLCRLAVRSSVSGSQLSQLFDHDFLPSAMRKFLAYKDL